MEDFSEDKESPQWVETLTQGSVMCVDCASDYGFNVPASEQPAESAPYAEWPWGEEAGEEGAGAGEGEGETDAPRETEGFVGREIQKIA